MERRRRKSKGMRKVKKKNVKKSVVNALLKQMEARTFLIMHFLYKPEIVSLFKFLQFAIAIKVLYECLIK